MATPITIPGQQTPEQMQAAFSASGQQPIAPAVSLAQAQAPTNVTEIKQTSGSKIPELTPESKGIDGVTGLVSYYKSLFDTSTKQAEDAKTQADAARATQQEQTKGFFGKIASSLSPTESRQQAQTATGIDPATYFADEKARIAEIDTLTSDYNTLVKNRDQQIAELTGQGRGIPLDLLNNQAAQISKNAAPGLNALAANINSKSAALQATQGLFSEAQQYIDKAVSAATADLKYNYDMYTTFYNQNQNIIDGLDSKYQTALKTATTAAQTAYESAQTEKNAIGKLMIDEDLVGAGITLQDTLDQANAKASAWLRSHPSLDTRYKLSQIEKNNQPTTTTGTESERTQATLNTLGQLFTPGKEVVGSGGIPFIDAEGKATPEGFREAIRVSGLPRDTVIKQYGNLLGLDKNGKVNYKYGLTPKEQALIITN